MLKKIIFYLCIGCLLTLQTACTVDENQVTETLDTSVISNYKVNLLTNGYQAELSLVNSTVDLVDEIRSSIVLSHPFEDPYNYEHMGYEIVSHSYSLVILFKIVALYPKGQIIMT